MSTDTFMAVCEEMGGEYESEYGNLEPDVGGLFSDKHIAGKEWCKFKNMEGLGKNNELVVFNSKNTFSMRLLDKSDKYPVEFFDIWDNDISKNFDKKNLKMVFEPRYGIRIPKGKYEINAYPKYLPKKYGKPNRIKLHFEG